MQDRGVVTINRRGIFKLEEAQAILPVVRRITQDFSQKTELLISRLESISPSQTETINELEAQVNELIKAWHEKIKKLGAVPKGLWLVDFDAGDGYFCWKYPEPQIAFWHSYEDGFTKRIPLSEKYSDIPEPIRSDDSQLQF